MARAPDIDRLIEDGLSRYGSGDLDGALRAWEQVLAIDPEHQQAKGYLEYVRENYEQLAHDRPQTPGLPARKPAAPADDDGDYELEMETLNPATVASKAAVEADDPSDPGYTLELEPGEPDDEAGAQPGHEPVDEPSFDGGTTREYLGGHTTPFGRPETPSEFGPEEATSSFHPEGTPVGFAQQETDVRKRELGFVQPAATPDVQVRLKKPEVAAGAPKGKPVAIGSAPTMELEKQRAAALELDVTQRAAPAELDPVDPADDLIASLPRPKPTPTAEPPRKAPTPTSEPIRKTTRELPGEPRKPASVSRPPADGRDLRPDGSAAEGRRGGIDPTAVSQAEVVLQHAATRELGREAAAVPALDPGPVPEQADPRAPTRELGLRGTRAPTSDDTPTREADVRAFRQHAATAQTARDLPKVRAKAPKVTAVEPEPERADTEASPPADALDARSAQIMAEVDTDAPARETAEDRTRRRISGLVDRALAWNGLGELEKAVAAVELAMSEEPASALAQKLVHRNRDTIMMVFQNYLGPLDRQPLLARPLHELAGAPISPRAAFLLSRIDGTLTIDEILDVSGMPRLEAYRYLCQLFLRGILK